MKHPMRVRAELDNAVAPPAAAAVGNADAAHAVAVGVARVRVLISHPMETGHRRDDTGELVALHFITELTAHYAERVVFQARLSPSVSANPYFAFKFAGAERGGQVHVDWRDNLGQTGHDSATIG